MRIVKLADLSEEERKKVLEEQQQRINENKQASEQMQRQANESFNNLISKEGEFKTSNKTTIGNITKAYKNTNNYNTVKNSLDSYYNQNKKNTNMWDAIKDRTMFIANKTGAGVLSGTFGIGQGLITDTANNMKKGEKEDSNELIKNLVNSFSSQNPTDYMMKNLPTYAKKQIESLKDKDKNGIEKAVSFVNNAVSEVGNSYNNKLGVLSELVGKISPNTSEELLKANNKISEPINEINKKLDKESEKYGTVANTIANVGQAVGNMTPSILSSVITKNPNVGLATMGLSSKGQSTQEALNKGAELDKAVKIGNTKAMIEVGTEMLTGGVNIFGKGALDDITEKGILNKVKSNVGKVVAKQGLNVAGETLEETISDILGTAIDKGTVDPNAKYSLKDWKDTAITTTLTTLVLNSLGVAGDIKNISKENKANQNAQKWLKEAESIVNKNDNIDLQQNTIQKQLNTQEQQVMPIQDESALRFNIIENSTINKATIKDFNESAKQYNIDYKNEDLKEIKQMFDKRGINAYFDENTFQKNNDAFSVWKPTYDEQGNISGREVVFNPKAQDTNTRVQELAIHELGHDLDLNEVQDMILKDASRKENWKSARESLENTYRKAYENDNIQISEENFKKVVDEEATMSILQRELGNQEYVNRLVNQNQSVAKKIYNWVIDKLNKFTGGKNEKLFWTDIRNKFETAYNQEFSKNDSDLKYSIAGKEALKNIKEPQLSQEAYNSYNKAKQMAKNKENNEKIYKETGWYKDKVTGKMKFNFSDKDMKIANQNYKVGQEFKLKDILVHNTLFEMYPQLKDCKVKIEDMNSYNTKNNGKLNGRYNRLTDELTIDINRFNDISNAEGTLIHEIQHAIQKIEGFAGGTSIKVGKEKYKNNPGEIEARDTSKRMIEEKYNGKDLSNIMPKSANVNTSILEKMKIGLYNYLNNISNEEVSNEFNESNKKKSSSNTSENNGLVLGGIEKSNVESENNSGSFSFDKNVKRYEDLETANNVKFNKQTDGQINVEILNDNELINQFTVNSKEESTKQLGNDISNYIYENANENMQTLNLKQQDKSDYKPITHKEKQLDIIKKTNPMLDDYHVGIRNIEDIKTFEEAINDKESFSWGDYSKEDAERDLKRNKVQVYSSYTIKNGTFVSTSYIQALEYAGMDKSKVHSKEIKPSEVAWINGDEGQYANINQKYALPIKGWQQFVESNYQKQGTGKNLKEYNLPIGQKIQADINLKKFKEDYEINNDIITKSTVPLSENMQEEKAAKILSKAPDKIKESDRKWAIFKANILDKGIVFEELSHKTKNRDLQGKWDYTLSATARGQNAIGNARYEFDSKTKKQKQISKSLEEIRSEVGDSVGEFSSYMYHQLNVDRMTLEERFGGDTGINYERKDTIKNKPVFGDNTTADISRNIVKELERKHPKFKDYAQDVYDFLNANKSELVKNGVISQESADHMENMYPHYVPIGRVGGKGSAINVALDTNKTGINSPIKSAKGGNTDILPLFDTIAQRTLQTYRASARNSFGVELKNTLNTVSNIEKTNVDNVIETMGQTIEEQNLLQEGKNGNNPTFTVFEKGEKVTYEITKDMYDALKPVGDSSILGKTIKPLNKISNFRRGVLTEYNPLFMVTNAIKDAQDVLINSQHSAKTYSKFPEAYAQIVKEGYWYKEYVQNGGEQNSYFNANDNTFESDIKQSKTKNALKIPLEAISNINNVIELAPRLSEYIASRESGRSVETSMLDASRVTTNFKAGGDVTKFANRNGATFLNASVQGMMQQARNISEANTKGLKGYAVLATKYAVAGLPALILNNLVWKDDKDYDELQDYVKDNYYCIAKYGDGKFIRIPKGRMLSTIQTMVTNVSDYVTKDKEINIDNFASDFWKDIQSIMDNVAPNNPLDNNVISPIIQAISNTSWYGEDIVPSRLQDKPKAEQYDETTDSLSIWLGKKLNVSPYKINYLLDQYGGGISDVALPLMTKQAENNPIEDKFTTDSVMKNKYAGDFFETADKLKVNANSSNATDEDKIKYKYISSIQNDLSELYTKKREIQNSNLSDKNKKEQLKEVQKQINEIAKDGINSLENLKTTNNTATVGDNQYYKITNLKTKEKEWKELTKEEKEKNKNISLKTYAEYKEKIAAETIKQRELGIIDKEEGQLKNKDKINVLLNSKYSNNEKTAIYENYIKTQIKKDEIDTFDALKKCNIDINEYLKYKLQDFESDKKDDGTTSGKSISGSKKKKVYSYVNSMNITKEQRLILLGTQYKLSNSERTELANLINKLPNTTKNEKMKLYEKMQGFTVYKNGTIKW